MQGRSASPGPFCGSPNGRPGFRLSEGHDTPVGIPALVVSDALNRRIHSIRSKGKASLASGQRRVGFWEASLNALLFRTRCCELMQIVDRFRSHGCGREDGFLVLLQHLQPALQIAGMVFAHFGRDL